MRAISILITLAFVTSLVPTGQASETTDDAALAAAEPTENAALGAAEPAERALLGGAEPTGYAAPATPGPGTPAPVAPKMPVDALLALPDADDPIDVHVAFLSFLEHQGLYPLGTAERLKEAAAAASSSRGAPQLKLLDTHPFCDIDGDGYDELIQNEYNLKTGRTLVRVIDGDTGRTKWTEYQSLWFPYPRGWEPPLNRPLNSQPLPDTHFVAKNFGSGPDFNGDGTCDLATYTMSLSFGIGELVINIDIKGLNGKNGDQLWRVDKEAKIITAGGLGATAVEVLDFPTGFLVYETPSGPKFIYKTVDVHWHRYDDPIGLGIYARDLIVNDHIGLYDATDGSMHWQKDLDYNREAERINITFLAGVSDLGGDEEPEIILEQLWMTAVETTTLPAQTPLDEDPTEVQYGRGMDMLSLRGETDGSGDVFWHRVIYDEGVARARPPAEEENFESIVWAGSQIMPDFDGDGRDEIMALFLATESGAPSTINGQFRTHFVPLSGADGEMLWGNQVRFQGWGAAQLLRGTPADGAPGNGTGNATAAGDFIGIGTIDLPTAPPPGGSFPPKDVRMAVLEAEDGSPVWNYHEQFAQDSYLSYHLALIQYRENLAPFDLDGDGVLDLVTPAKYVKPKATEQVMLSTATQEFDIRSGATGEVLQTLTAFGSNGLALACSDRPEVTVVGGYGKRLDAMQFNATSGQEDWHWTMFIDASPTAATAGVDINFLGGGCHTDGADRTMMTLNMGLYSSKRGFEFLPLYGAIEGPEEDVLWFRPGINREVPIHELLERLFAPDELTSSESVVRDATPAIPGLMLGTALGVLNRRRPTKKDDLPDLYGGR